MNKLLNLLKYIGIIGASISSIAYIFVVLVLINGFKVENNTQTLVFAIVNALVGFVILCFLKVQGEIFAKNLPENKKIIDEYYSHNTKDKKYHSIKFYWITSTIKDLCTKVLSVFISTFGIIYIVVVGSNDWNLLLLALVNLLLFISFGLLGLNNTFEYYNNRHVPFMVHMIKAEKELKFNSNDNTLKLINGDNENVENSLNLGSNEEREEKR